MNKVIRQQKIRELVGSREISGQQELLALLDEVGIRVAQATLSRDFAEIGIMRKRFGSSFRLIIPEETQVDGIRGLVGMEVISVLSNETSIIIRTLPGRAHGVGSFIDRIGNADILGTIAGDDTLLVIPASISRISSIITSIQNSLSQT